MIIIGILAAIAIPVFLSQRAKAQDSAAKADVSTIGKELASYFVDNTAAPVSIDISGSRYVLTIPPATSGGANTTQDIGKVSTNVGLKGTTSSSAVTTYAGTNMTSSAWCVSVVNPQGSTQSWKYSAQNGLEKGDCTNATTP
jgi:type II secretory pathway pseudopilin PulG